VFDVNYFFALTTTISLDRADVLIVAEHPGRCTSVRWWAAVGGYLDARAHQGEWLVRTEDVDTRRCSPRCAADILRTPEVFGFEWDGLVLYQSSPERQRKYQPHSTGRPRRVFAILAAVRAKGFSIRKQVRRPTIALSGTYRDGVGEAQTARAWRPRVDDNPAAFTGRV
jgi:glutamyl-Q tRNA(Asp) synthetase